MKENTTTAKSYLIQAIKNMPNDFALSEARTYLNFALAEIQKVEKKRGKRAGVQAQQKMVTAMTEAKQSQTARQPVAQPWSVNQVQNALHYIDNLIQQEQHKIEEIKRQRELDKQLNQIQQSSTDDELLQG